jgi:hypothetical protein
MRVASYQDQIATVARGGCYCGLCDLSGFKFWVGEPGLCLKDSGQDIYKMMITAEWHEVYKRTANCLAALCIGERL